MSKKEMAAPQNGTTTNARPDHITRLNSEATKRELVACHLLSNGPTGISALSALAGLSDLNARNSISELRRHNGIIILDEFFPHQHSGGGVVHLKRYWLADREQARKAIELINHKRTLRGATLLNQEHIDRYLSLFPLPQHAA